MKILRVFAAALLAVAVVAAWTPARERVAGWLDRDRAGDDELVLYGNVDVRELELAFRQAGRMLAVQVDEGDRVAAGELVATLDDEPFRERVAAAAAEVDRARAELDALEHGSRPQEIARAAAEVRRVRAVLTNAERELARRRSLLAGHAASQTATDAAQAARDEAAAALVAAQEALALARLGPRVEDLAAGRARLAAAQAALDSARTALADTRLTAPAAAEVLARIREPGSMVGPAQAVLSLSLRDPVYVRAYVAEPALGRVVPGTPVTVLSDSRAAPYHGHVGFVSPRAEFTPKSVESTALRTDLVYRLRVVVDDADDGLRQGMPVTVRFASPAAD